MHVHTRRVIDAGSSLTAHVASRLEHEIERVVIGQEKAVHDVILAVLAGGHCLLTGASGLGKSLMGTVVAQATGAPLTQIACTPGTRERLLPEDGVVIIEELERAAPAVRGALLELEPRHATVFATHNPNDAADAPLTQGELDRFLLSTPFEYPTAEEERELLRRTQRPGTAAANAVIDAGELQRARAEVREVPAASNIIEYAARLARSSRPLHEGEVPDFVHELVAAGAGPRGAQALLAAARAHALIEGEAAVSLDDVDAVAPAVLRHRLVLTGLARRQGLTSDDVISRLLPLARSS
ncbi:MAG: MoxR family ATPase [Acidobacteriota bacterium]|nr:MoxR family ATPase [Acidobacteriota bacterium]